MARLFPVVLVVCIAAFFGTTPVHAGPFTRHTNMEKLEEAVPVGSPFTQRLTVEYRNYMRQKRKWLDNDDAHHFAKKGMLAAEGQAVLPEPLSNWRLNARAADILRDKRRQLMEALEGGGRAQAPIESARAQAAFDCWIEQEEQNWFIDGVAPCRVTFDRALGDLNARLVAAMPQSVNLDKPVEPRPDPNGLMAKRLGTGNGLADGLSDGTLDGDDMGDIVDPGADEGMFLAFFDFDRAELTDSGLAVVAAVADQVAARGTVRRLRITGHADTAGPDAYNDRLSQRRADAVKGALIARGIDADLITTAGLGEREPMVPTPNNTREAANRRAEIVFE